MTIERNQVWEHRALCRLCPRQTAQHHHRYLIISVEPNRVMVRDLTTNGRTEGSRYARPLHVFGSLEKGGLRLCGHWVQGRVQAIPVDQLDTRPIEHPRVQLRSVPYWAGKQPEALAA